MLFSLPWSKAYSQDVCWLDFCWFDSSSIVYETQGWRFGSLHQRHPLLVHLLQITLTIQPSLPWDSERLDKALEVLHYYQQSLWHSDFLSPLKALLLSLCCVASAPPELHRWTQTRPRLVAVLVTEGVFLWFHWVLQCCSRAAQSLHPTDDRARWQWHHSPQVAQHQSWGEAAAPYWSGSEALHEEWSLDERKRKQVSIVWIYCKNNRNILVIAWLSQ